MSTPRSESLYIAQWERFIFRRNGAWDRTTTYSKDAFAHHLARNGVQPKVIKKTLLERDYPIVDEIVMAPGEEEIFTNEDGIRCLNTWVAPTIVPAPGEYPLITEILNWLTNSDPNGIFWIKNWMAQKVQNPAIVPKVAPVFTTEPGGGKGSIAFVLRHMLGPQNCDTIEKEDLQSRFNAKWVDKIFVLADEVLSSDNRADVSDRLKVLIDAEYVTREGKGRDQQTIKSHLSWMFASNSRTSAVVVEKGDRRYSVFSNHNKVPLDYKARLEAAFLPGGKPAPSFEAEIAAFMHDLLNLEVDKRLACRPYDNGDRNNLIEASKTSSEAFFEELVESGIDVLVHDVPEYGHRFDPKYRQDDWDFGEAGVSIQAIYDAYRQFCKAQGMHAVKKTKLSAEIQTHPAAWTRSRPQHKATGRRVVCYAVPRKPRDET